MASPLHLGVGVNFDARNVALPTLTTFCQSRAA